MVIHAKTRYGTYSTVQYCTVLYNAVQWISIYGYPYVGSMDPLRWPVGSWGARPPPRPVQTLAVACGEEKFAIAVWPRGFGNAIREIYYTHGRCKRLRWPVRFAEEREAGMGGPKLNLTFNPLAKLHPARTKTEAVY